MILPLALALAIAPQSATLSPQALQADLAIAKRALEALHTGLYRYQTPEQWSELNRKFEKRFGKPHTLGEAYVAFSEYLHPIRCGHTFCNFYNQGKTVSTALLSEANHLPFRFRWIGGKMVVTQCLLDRSDLPPGTIVNSVEGVPSSELLRKMMAITRADGRGEAKRLRTLDVQGGDRYEAFEVFLPLLFNVAPPYDLDVTLPTGKRTALQLPAPQPADLARGQKPVNEQDQPWTTVRPRQDTALLTMPTWAMYNSKWNWAGWLDQTMDEIQRDGIQNLIVDLRGNEGGLDCGDSLLKRVVQKPITIAGAQRWVTYRKVPSDLDAVLDTWDPSFRNWGLAAQRRQQPKAAAGDPRPFYWLTRFDDDGVARVIRPRGNRFTGRMFVLVDAVCSSATFQFASIVKQNRLATIVGETTGGNQRGINGGAFFFCRLPNTRIEFDIPLIATFPADDQPSVPDAGIEPDVRVVTTARDIAANRDPQMERVLSLIERG